MAYTETGTKKGTEPALSPPTGPSSPTITPPPKTPQYSGGGAAGQAGGGATDMLPEAAPGNAQVVLDDGSVIEVMVGTRRRVVGEPTPGWVTYWVPGQGWYEVMPRGGPMAGSQELTAQGGPSGGGGSGWSSWGGGGGGGGNDQYYRDFLDNLFGYGLPGSAPQALVDRAVQNGWTEDQMVYYAIKEYGADGPYVDGLRRLIERTAAQVFGPGWSEVIPDSLITGLMLDNKGDTGWLDDYFRSLPGYDALNDPAAIAMIDYWMAATGIPLTWTARNELRRILDEMGPGPMATAVWEEFVNNSDSAWNGNQGAAIREGIWDDTVNILRREPTDEEIEAMRYMNPAARLEYLRGTPEYQELYELKPVWMSEEQWWNEIAVWDQAYRQAYGINTYEASLLEPTRIERTDLKDEWAALTQEDLATGGWGWDKGGYFNMYMGKKTYYEPDTVAEMLGWQYDPSTGVFFQLEVPEGIPQLPGAPDGWSEGMIAGDWDPEEWLQHIEWTEMAIVNEGVYDPVLMETMGIDLSADDWYIYTSHAIGWGAIQLTIIEAQNRAQFREVFRNYTGRDPDPADYDYLMENYVSPSEYARRMAAKEDAAAKFPEVNELLQRVYGSGTSLSELENMAMGGEGSGVLEAKINQALKLDQYRWIHKQYYGEEPTPADYARYAGYASPAELQWEITVTEKIAEFGPDIREAWQAYYGENITDEMLKTLFGEMEGSGDIAYQVKEAEEYQQKQERAREISYSAAWALQPTGAAESGGFRSAMPGLPDISMS